MPLDEELETAKRHVTEGAAHIARQRQLIAELRRDGHDTLARDGETLLETLQASQRLHEEHLERLTKATGKSRPREGTADPR
jgi:ribosomal 50S subunit-associated protein YjgA (DUF615 family)